MKRYLRVLTTGDIKDTFTGELIRGSRVGDLLNDLNNENKQLKQDRRRLINHLKMESVLWRDESYLNELILDNEMLDGDVK